MVKTCKSNKCLMDEINTQVTAINKTITVVDQNSISKQIFFH